MIAPRLEIDLDKLHHNAHTLVDRLADRRISVMGVTKATLGSPEIANTLLRAGVTSLGDARIENIEAMRSAGVRSFMVLLRSPMLSQVDRVVASADMSFNTELAVISALADAANRTGTTHDVVLMVELGDLREGIMPADLEATVREVLTMPGVVFRGIGANLACRNGIAPDARNMAELSDLARAVEATFRLPVDVVSGGSSANLNWILGGSDRGRVNELRLGESILLGCEPLHRQPIPGLYTDAFTLVAEVIESKSKPTVPWGEVAQSAFGMPTRVGGGGQIQQAILALGRQDVDPQGLTPPPGVQILSASSDHLVVDAGHVDAAVGRELRFQLNYAALLAAMTSPFVTKVVSAQTDHHRQPRAHVQV
jgi:ornithine racemase